MNIGEIQKDGLFYEKALELRYTLFFKEHRLSKDVLNDEKEEKSTHIAISATNLRRDKNVGWMSEALSDIFLYRHFAKVNDGIRFAFPSYSTSLSRVKTVTYFFTKSKTTSRAEKAKPEN